MSFLTTTEIYKEVISSFFLPTFTHRGLVLEALASLSVERLFTAEFIDGPRTEKLLELLQTCPKSILLPLLKLISSLAACNYYLAMNAPNFF